MHLRINVLVEPPLLTKLQDTDYSTLSSILSDAQKQLSALPSARHLYLKAKHQLVHHARRECGDHLTSLEFCQIRKPGHGIGFHLGQLSFLLRAASETLPIAVNLQCWSIQSVYSV